MRLSVKLQNRLSLGENILLAQLMEHRGLDGVWVSEYSDRDGISVLAMLGRATERIRVGASIIPIYTRSPVVLGMSAASLSEAAPRRISLGLGTSTQVIVEAWNGTRREKPLVAMREYVAVIRAVLAGDRVDHEGEVVRVRGFRYERADLASSIDLPVAALGPRMRELAGEIGDGVLLNMLAAAHLGEVRRTVAAGAGRAGRAAPPIMSDVRVGIVGPQAEEDLRGSLRRLVAGYGRVPPYNRHYAESGFDRQAELLRRAWEQTDRDGAFKAVDDGMLDSLVVVGSHDEIIERLAELEATGLDEAILYPTILEGDEVEGIQQVVGLAVEAKERLS